MKQNMELFKNNNIYFKPRLPLISINCWPVGCYRGKMSMIKCVCAIIFIPLIYNID